MEEFNDFSFDYLRDYLNTKVEYAVSQPDENSVHKLMALIQYLLNQMEEIYEFSYYMAKGDLSKEISRSNHFADPLKDLQSSLRHLKWQTQQIAKGDYEQEVNFLGEFSTSFNEMAEKLKEREAVERQKTKIEKQMLESKALQLQRELELKINYYEHLEEKSQELRDFRHDMKNHLLCLNVFLERGDIEEAREYLASISTVLSKRKEVISTGNVIFDALLSEKLEVANSFGIQFFMDISIREKLKIENVDWCILFGNSIDNAIEACQRLEHSEKIIYIKMVSKGNVVTVRMVNPIETTPIKINGSYKSCKEDEKGDHGLGIENMKRVAEKYNGYLNVEHTNNKFYLTMFLLLDLQIT